MFLKVCGKKGIVLLFWKRFVKLQLRMPRPLTGPQTLLLGRRRQPQQFFSLFVHQLIKLVVVVGYRSRTRSSVETRLSAFPPVQWLGVLVAGSSSSLLWLGQSWKIQTPRRLPLLLLLLLEGRILATRDRRQQWLLFGRRQLSRWSIMSRRGREGSHFLGKGKSPRERHG